MNQETDQQYFARRELEELALARAAPSQAGRDAHNTLAIEYGAKCEAVISLGSGGTNGQARRMAL